MWKVLIGIAVVVVLIVGALFALPMFIPSETVRAELSPGSKRRAGREVRIDGPIEISVLPTASLSAGGVGSAGSLERARPSRSSPFLRARACRSIGGNVEINALTIVGPASSTRSTRAGSATGTRPPPSMPPTASRT